VLGLLSGTYAVSPPDPGDQWTYFNAMAALGTGGNLVAPPVNFSMGSCTTNLSGSDDVYQDRCPQPWVNIDAAPTADTARAVFPYAYFLYLQNYVRAALAHKPPDTASPKAKILWLLDVQTVATMALLMLNIPLRGQGYTRRGFVGLPDANPTPAREVASPVLQPFLNAQKLFYDNLALARFAGYDPRQLSDPKYKAELAAAPIMPAAFAALPVFWIGNAYRQWKGLDQVYAVLFGGVIPTQAANWYGVPSYANKDAASLKDAVSRNDAPLIRGIYQWRMWCVRDGLSGVYVDPSIAPLGLGTAVNTPNLVDYISHVSSYERQFPELVLQTGKLYPNFAHAFAAADRIGAQVLSVNYQLEVRKHVGAWAARNSPKLDASGNPAFDKQSGQNAQQPVTYTDNDAFLRGLGKEVADRAKLAIANPGYACGDDKACQTAWNGATVHGTQIPGMSSVYSLAQKSPLGPFIQGGLAIASFLVNKFGAAIGGGYWPFFVIDLPFARTFTAAGWRTVPDGSSVDVLMRVLIAVQNIERLTGLALLTPPPPLPPKPVVVTPSSASTQPGTAPVVTVDPCAVVVAGWEKQHPDLAKCITIYDRSAMVTACHALRSGRMGMAEYTASIDKIVATACQKQKSSSIKVIAVAGVSLAAAGGAITWFFRSRGRTLK
jgi:hypothetical protein